MKIDIEDINEFNELDNIVSNPNQYRLLCQIMYQGSYDLILITNKLGKIISVNKAGIDFSGFKREEVYGKFYLNYQESLIKMNLEDALKFLPMQFVENHHMISKHFSLIKPDQNTP